MEQESLFEEVSFQPLASRMRPASLSEYVGQKHLVGEGKVLWKLIEKDQITSMIFWGPPGVGKTTLVRIIAHHTKSRFIDFSAVTSGIREIRQVMKEAQDSMVYGQRTILFVDEIHRFNKAQQDAFLPYVEKGSIILIGATTENPSFEINSALLSRCKVFVLKALEDEDILELLKTTLHSPKGLGKENIQVEESILKQLAAFANGGCQSGVKYIGNVCVECRKYRWCTNRK